MQSQTSQVSQVSQVSQTSQTLRIFRVFLRLLIISTSIVGAFILISIALSRAMHQKVLGDRIRHFNKQTLNPTTLKIAGNRSGIYASLKHIGRRSGHEYITPVVAKPLGDNFVVPLPYGSNVDWCRNVMAAGKCTLLWNEHEYALEKPEIVTLSEALGAFPLTQRIIFAAGGVKQFVLLRQHIEVPEKVSMSV
jgi:hypothetical protein